MKCLKPTVFVPTSLALAMAVVLPSIAFADVSIEELPEAGIIDEKHVFIGGDGDAYTLLDNSEHTISHTIPNNGRFQNTKTAYGTVTQWSSEPSSGVVDHILETKADGISIYSLDERGENYDSVIDLNQQNGLSIYNRDTGATFGVTEDGLVGTKLNNSNEILTIGLQADELAFRTTDASGAVIAEHAKITPYQIKNLAAATEDGDAISFGQFNEVVDGVNETVSDLDDAISAVSASVGEINKATKANDVAIQKNSRDNQLNAVKINKLDQDVRSITENIEKNIETADISNAFMDKINARQWQVVARVTKDTAERVEGLTGDLEKITKRLNANNTGMIGVPPSSPSTTIIQTNSAAIKQLNDNLAATDKRLDESNQRLNSAIDINDGVLTIKNDMNANNKKITKVANATNDSDAVNLGQLKAYVAGNSQAGAGMNQLKGDVVRLDKNLKQGMAAQSALNGLFQPYGVGKFSATAAVGGYGTETAVAVGTGYRFNENLAGKGGIAFPVGNASQATYNLGVNYEW